MIEWYALTSSQKEKEWELHDKAKKCKVSAVDLGMTVEKGEEDDKEDDKEDAGNQFVHQVHEHTSNKKKGKE